jgi:hypothetical protein
MRMLGTPQKPPPESDFSPLHRSFVAGKSGNIGTGTPQECHVGSEYFYPLIHDGFRCQI